MSQSEAATLSEAQADTLFSVLYHVGDSLVSAEEQLNRLDAQSGDGDCGSTLARGAKALLEQLGSRERPGLSVSCPSRCARELAAIAETVMGGSSGALYSIMLTAAAVPLQTALQPADWTKALATGIQSVMKYGGAKPQQRTMLDPLDAACSSLSTQRPGGTDVDAFVAAVAAAKASAEGTALMKAQAGRASYVSPDLLTQPDPGAIAVAIWMNAVAEKLVSP